jgi:hypothetical protein
VFTSFCVSQIGSRSLTSKNRSLRFRNSLSEKRVPSKSLVLMRIPTSSNQKARGPNQSAVEVCVLRTAPKPSMVLRSTKVSMFAEKTAVKDSQSTAVTTRTSPCSSLVIRKSTAFVTVGPVTFRRPSYFRT